MRSLRIFVLSVVLVPYFARANRIVHVPIHAGRGAPGNIASECTIHNPSTLTQTIVVVGIKYPDTINIPLTPSKETTTEVVNVTPVGGTTLGPNESFVLRYADGANNMTLKAVKITVTENAGFLNGVCTMRYGETNRMYAVPVPINGGRPF